MNDYTCAFCRTYVPDDQTCPHCGKTYQENSRVGLLVMISHSPPLLWPLIEKFPPFTRVKTIPGHVHKVPFQDRIGYVSKYYDPTPEYPEGTLGIEHVLGQENPGVPEDEWSGRGQCRPQNLIILEYREITPAMIHSLLTELKHRSPS